MYHYRSSLTFVYGLASLIIVGLTYKVFDFIAKHKFIGILIYIAVSATFLYAARECVDIGSRTYPIHFMLWFMTPQDSLEYNKWYTIAIFLLFTVFMSSVIYYFTKIRYRIFMNFLIFIIPFSIYGKEYEKMPTAFIILLATGYIIIMINSRQLAENDNTVVVGRLQTWSSVSAYIIMFAVSAAVIPKPPIEADRSYLDEMINADAFTDRLVEMLNVFRDTSSNEAFRNANNEQIIYYAKSDEPLKLKTQVFTHYDYETDSWSADDENIRFDYDTTGSITRSADGELLEAIGSALKYNPGLAEKYNLTEFDVSRLSIPEPRECTIYTAGTYAQFAPVPTQFISADFALKSKDEEVALLRNGSVYICEDYFSTREEFTYTYTPDTFFTNPNNKALADMIPTENYEEFLRECRDVTLVEDSAAWYVIYKHVTEISLFDAYLDYGDMTEIKTLADEITEGLTSDYDKAKAIERYFSEEDFTYDLSYKKDKGDNAVTFLFENKTGVCYEFASAMVLLSRAAGIPARFTEGYSMQEASDKEGMDFVIKAKHAHGFPELYIKGVGWISFEPTISSDEQTAEDDKTATDNLAKAGVILLLFAVGAVVIILVYPSVSHKVFLIKIARNNPEKAVIKIMQRIISLYRLGNSVTSCETAEHIIKLTGVDITSTAEIFDKAAYGSESISPEELLTAKKDYIAVYNARKELKKQSRRKKKISA